MRGERDGAREWTGAMDGAGELQCADGGVEITGAGCGGVWRGRRFEFKVGRAGGRGGETGFEDWREEDVSETLDGYGGRGQGKERVALPTDFPYLLRGAGAPGRLGGGIRRGC